MICKVGVRQVPVDSIVVGQRWRTPRPIKVEEMRVSLRDNGLLSPIGVRLVEEEQKEGSSAPGWILVYGATRLTAAKLEGWTEIDAQILQGSSVDFEKAELAENLHRGELSRLQRDRQIARYVELCGEKPFLRGPRAKMGKGRPKGGVRAVARELKLPESTTRDAMKVATMSAAVAEVVADLGLADKPADYRAVAAEVTVEAQIAKAQEIAASESKMRPILAAKTRISQLATLIETWKNAPAPVRQAFLVEIGHAACQHKPPSPFRRTPATGPSTTNKDDGTQPPRGQQLELDGLKVRPSATPDQGKDS
jgi:ParB family chromosome partitioning protein